MKRNIFKDFVMLSSSQMLTMIIGIANSMIISRVFSRQYFGTYSQIMLITSMIVVFFSLSIGSSVNYFLAQISDFREKRMFISQTLLVNIFMGLLAMGTIFLVFPYLVTYFNNKLLIDLKLVIGILPLISILDGIFTITFIALNHSKVVVITQIISSIIQVAITSSIYLIHLDIKTYLYIYLCYRSLVCIFTIGMVIKLMNGFEIHGFNIALQRKIFSYVLPIWAAGIVGTLSTQIDTLFVARMVGTSKFAEYANMSKELPIAMITGSLTTVLLPQVMLLYKQGNLEKIITLWKDSVELSFIIICTAVMSLLVLAPEVISFLYSDKYLAGVPVFRIYTLILLMRVTYFGMMLNVTGKTKHILYFTAGVLLLNSALVPILWKLIGYTGPAWANFISIFVIQIIQLIQAGKILKCGLRNIFPWKRMAIIIFINFICSILMISMNFFLKKWHIPSIGRLFIISSVWCVSILITYLNRTMSLKQKLVINEN